MDKYRIAGIVLLIVGLLMIFIGFQSGNNVLLFVGVVVAVAGLLLIIMGKGFLKIFGVIGAPGSNN